MQTTSEMLVALLMPVLAPAVDLCKYKLPDGGKQELVAVKRLRPSILKDKTELQLFVGETKLLKKLKHRRVLLDRPPSCTFWPDPEGLLAGEQAIYLECITEIHCGLSVARGPPQRMCMRLVKLTAGICAPGTLCGTSGWAAWGACR